MACGHTWLFQCDQRGAGLAIGRDGDQLTLLFDMGLLRLATHGATT